MIENLDGRISDERLKEIAAEQPPYSEYLDLCARAEKAEKDAAEWRRLKDQARAELASVKAELAALKAANRWIPVEERLPKTLQRVAVIFKVKRTGKLLKTIADYIAPRTVLAEDYLSDDCELSFSDYEEENDRYWTPAGWYEFQETAEINYYIDDQITHWWPLPDLPETNR